MIRLDLARDSEHLLSYEQAANAVFNCQGLSGKVLVEVIEYGEKRMRSLNLSSRNIDKSTDVLSFPSIDFCGEILPFDSKNYPLESLESGEVFLGSIVICKAIAKRQAVKFGHSFSRELAYLFVHGMLHLLGFDHILDDDKARMRKAEEEVLDKIGRQREV